MVQKLTIEAFKTIDCTGSSLGSIELQVNPETLKFKYEISWDGGGGGDEDNGGEGAAGESIEILKAPTYKFPEFSIPTFIIDATGVLPAPGKISLEEGGMPSVLPYITELKKICYNYIDTIHGPPFVKITWGKIMPASANAQDQVDGVFKGRLNSMDVEFTLFGAEGNPVRAQIDMSFGSAVNPETRPTGNSPDLSHIIDVKYGDNLPKLCKDIYGSPEFFLQVAKINNLPSIYAIEPGMQLLFPPLEKSSR
jgi:hypothetical protein